MKRGMGSPITRHADEGLVIDAGFHWTCHTVEGTTPAWTFSEDCHHCRIVDLAEYVNLGRWTPAQVGPSLAVHLGVPENTELPGNVVLRAACEVSDDVAVLRMLDRIEAS